jgi:hypothetical protein
VLRPSTVYAVEAQSEGLEGICTDIAIEGEAFDLVFSLPEVERTLMVFTFEAVAGDRVV